MLYKENHWQRRLSEMSALGGSLVFLSIALSFALLGNIDRAMFLVSGYLLTYLIAAPLRLGFFKERPEKRQYKNLFERLDAASFPSIHAQRAVFLAVTLAGYFKNTGLTVLFLLLAGLVCYSRVALRKHHLSDVLAGSVLGAAVYYLLPVIMGLL
ncbi:MAG: phosphatase PAP2 family protein [Candidatus Aenigmarchaeota archaeon]|nr:phosphatase PAP2 family protein [Candidatus Aenigmarchaeota archaeon]